MRITTADLDIGLVSYDTIVPSPAWAKYGQGFAGIDLCSLTNFITVTTEAAQKGQSDTQQENNCTDTRCSV